MKGKKEPAIWLNLIPADADKFDSITKECPVYRERNEIEGLSHSRYFHNSSNWSQTRERRRERERTVSVEYCNEKLLAVFSSFNSFCIVVQKSIFHMVHWESESIYAKVISISFLFLFLLSFSDLFSEEAAAAASTHNNAQRWSLSGGYLSFGKYNANGRTKRIMSTQRRHFLSFWMHSVLMMISHFFAVKKVFILSLSLVKLRCLLPKKKVNVPCCREPLTEATQW